MTPKFKVGDKVGYYLGSTTEYGYRVEKAREDNRFKKSGEWRYDIRKSGGVGFNVPECQLILASIQEWDEESI